MIDPNLAVVRMPDGTAILWHLEAGWEREVDTPIADLLVAFESPQPIAAVADTLARRSGDTSLALGFIEVIRECIDAGLLVANTDSPTRGRDRTGMFGLTRHSLARVLDNPPDVVFLGMPYDAGVSNRPGCRFGPTVLRQASKMLFALSDDEDEPVWSAELEANVFAGLTVVDVGDVGPAIFQRNGREFIGLRQACRNIARVAGVPVVLGGDHSITLPVVLGLADWYQELGVVQFDAHSDLADYPELDWQEACHHGNFMTWVAADERVRMIRQIGLREFGAPLPTLPTIRSFTRRDIVRSGVASIVEELQGIPVHLTFDVDVLDPSVCRSTGTPLPNGLTTSELLDVVRDLSLGCNIVGLDVVEFAPVDSTQLTLTDAIGVVRILVECVSHLRGPGSKS